MSTLATMRSRVALITQSHLGAADITALLNRVTQEELESRAWHRLKGTATLATVAAVTTGTIAIASGSSEGTGSGTGFVASQTGYAIRIRGDDIPLTFTYVTATAFAIDAAWPGATVSGGTYSLAPRVYAVSGAQHVRTVARHARLHETTQEELDAMDPHRVQTSSPATRWAPAGRDSSDNARIELWPRESGAALYRVEYLRAFTALSADGDVPLIPGAVVENKAIADVAASMYAQNGDDRWDKMSERYYRRYQAELATAIEADSRQYGRIFQVRDADGGGLGADLAYNHDVT